MKFQRIPSARVTNFFDHAMIFYMKTAAVIAEFNPFHKGHEYFLGEVRNRSGADFIIAVMSGDFVQRGEPAIADKYTRAETALAGGCDLVLELPVRWALGDAGSFAYGAVSILHALNTVDELWFGSESGRVDPFQRAARVLLEEPAPFKESMQSRLKSGASYPKARAEAFCELYGENNAALFSSPNNILGLEYAAAAFSLNSTISLNTIQRYGGYNDPDINASFASALAVREAVLAAADSGKNTGGLPKSVCTQLPSCSEKLLRTRPGFLTPDDFSGILRYRLMEETAQSLSEYEGISPDLAGRIKNRENGFSSFSDFAMKLKTRNYTYSHIARALFHIILKIKKRAPQSFPKSVHLLGMKNCGELTKSIKQNSAVRLEASMAGVPDEIHRETLFASNLYESLLSIRFGAPFVHEYEHKLVRI